MRKLGVLWIFLSFFLMSDGWAYKLTRKVTVLYLGQTPVKIIEYRHGPGKHFVHVHDNEITARRAALKYIKIHGGSLLTIVHSRSRNIRFVLRHQEYFIDPNRIYTHKGARETLSNLSHYSPAAILEVEKFAQHIIRRLPWKRIIAVHNNKDYSMRSYFKYNSLSNDVSKINHAKRISLRNFYLVTRYAMYRKLSRLGFNVVLQSRHANNDGSMSVRLAQRNYINVEAAYGADRIQYKMLRNI